MLYNIARSIDFYDTYTCSKLNVFISSKYCNLGISRNDANNKFNEIWSIGKLAFENLITCSKINKNKTEFDELINAIDEKILSVMDGLSNFLETSIKSKKIIIHDTLGQIYTPNIKELDIYQLAIITDTFIHELKLKGSDIDYFYNRELIFNYLTLSAVRDCCSTMGDDVDSISAHHYNLDTLYEISMHLNDQKKIEEKIDLIIKAQALKKQKNLNAIRHAKTKQAADLVTSDWLKNIDKFQSVTRASNHYADWLLEKGLEYQPRTIAKWISKFAKENNIRL